MANETTPLKQYRQTNTSTSDANDEGSEKSESLSEVHNGVGEEEEVPTADSKTANNDPDLREVLSKTRLMGSTRLFDTYNNERDELARRDYQRRPSWALAADSRLVQSGRLALENVQSSFLQDARNLAEGSVPQSIVLSIVIGTLCGVVCYLYYSILFFLLEFIWHTVPEKIFRFSPEGHFWWIPLVSLTMAVCVGLSVKILGEPGDLPFTIRCVFCFCACK